MPPTPPTLRSYDSPASTKTTVGDEASRLKQAFDDLDSILEDLPTVQNVNRAHQRMSESSHVNDDSEKLVDDLTKQLVMMLEHDENAVTGSSVSPKGLFGM